MLHHRQQGWGRVIGVGVLRELPAILGCYPGDQLRVFIPPLCSNVRIRDEDQASDTTIGVIGCIGNHLIRESPVEGICHNPVVGNVVLGKARVSAVCYKLLVRVGIAESSIHFHIFLVLK